MQGKEERNKKLQKTNRERVIQRDAKENKKWHRGGGGGGW